MLDDLVSIMDHCPNVWGEGTLFAFSGMDGETCSAAGFVASLWSPRFDLLFHLQEPRRLRLRVAEPAETEIATGDTLAVRTPAGPLLVTWAAWHTLVGFLPSAACAELVPDDSPPVITWSLVEATAPGQHVALGTSRSGRFAVGFGLTAEEADRRARAGLRRDPWAVATRRLEALRTLRLRANDVRAGQALSSTERSRLLNKCLSVMRVNTLSAEGAIRQTWSTPDRVPHRHMWLWDSVFHTMAMSPLDPQVAWQYLKSVLDFARPDGLIPITMRVDGAAASDMTQPPVLAWGVWHNYLAGGRKVWLEEALPRLEGYLAWNLRHRDRNGNGLLEWTIEDTPVCRCGESGMDNSPRFDAALPLDAVDFSAFQAHDMHHVGLIAQALGHTCTAQRWFDRSQQVSQQIYTYLWDGPRGFYVDRDLNGHFTGIEAASGFVPLLLESCPPEHVAALVAALEDPRRFGTPLPVPSLSRSDPAFSTDMWRGPMWLNLNYLVVLGLRRHGRAKLAAAIARRTVETVQRYYEKHGVVFEFYDALDERSPVDCDRKGPRSGPYLSRPYGDSIRDYHWSAALTACLLLGLDDPNKW